jgi:hypothetical protein
MDAYDYSGMSHFIEEFQNPFTDRPFISEMVENYGTLWKFRDCVVEWSLGVSRYKGYTHVLHKESNSSAFLPLNVLEKVILIEQFHSMYIVIGIQAVNAEGAELDHVHSIVVKVGDGSAQFDVEGLLTNLRNTAQEELADLLWSMYSPWTATDAESENPAVEPNFAIAFALSGPIYSKNTNGNAHCNPTRGRVRCHGIRKWSSGEQQQEYCSSTWSHKSKGAESS